MSQVMIEFWERGRKVAECPAGEVFDLNPEQEENFWKVQDICKRAIMLKEVE